MNSRVSKPGGLYRRATAGLLTGLRQCLLNCKVWVPARGGLLAALAGMTPVWAAALFLLAACVSTHGDRGYMARFSNHSQIKPGVTSREEVLGVMGSPSATSGYGQETWYYIHTRTAQAAFLDPKIEGQKVIAVAFGPQGVVSNVTVDEGKNRRDIAIAGDKTPTAGHDVNAAEQLLGNLGRFNTDRAQNP